MSVPKLPLWGTNTNYISAPALQIGTVVAGTPVKVAPTSGKQADGWYPEEGMYPQYLNYWQNLVYQWASQMLKNQVSNWKITATLTGTVRAAWWDNINMRWYLGTQTLGIRKTDANWTTDANWYSGATSQINDITGDGAGAVCAVTQTGHTYYVTAGGSGTDTSISANPLNSIVYYSGLYVTVGGAGATSQAYTSPDGVTWTARTVPTAGVVQSIAVSPAGVYAACTNTSGNILKSTNGTTWTNPASLGGDLRGMTWEAQSAQFVCVGTSGHIWTSPDATTWTARTSNTTNDLDAVASDGSGSIVAISGAASAGMVVISGDYGVTWVPMFVEPAGAVGSCVSPGNGGYMMHCGGNNYASMRLL